MRPGVPPTMSTRMSAGSFASGMLGRALRCAVVVSLVTNSSAFARQAPAATPAPAPSSWGVPPHVMPQDAEAIGAAFQSILARANMGDLASAERDLSATVGRYQSNYFLWMNVSAYYKERRAARPMIDGLARALATAPDEPTALYSIASNCFEVIAKEPFSKDVWRELADLGLTAIDRALRLEPDYIDAVVVKALLIRAKGRIERDPALANALMEEGAVLAKRAQAMRALKESLDRFED